MDIIALGLFAIGVLLVAAGYFLNHQNSSSQRTAMMVAQQMAERAEQPQQRPNHQPSQPFQQPVNHINSNQQANTSSTVNYNPQPTFTGFQSQFQQPQAAPSPAPPQPQQPQQPSAAPGRDPNFQVDVVVQNSNPRLFQKSAYLYLDSSQHNNYTGTEAAFKLQDVMGIRRFGQGIFSYDGFIFRFEHQGGVENFPLENLDHMAFYPNCVVLVLKNDLPAALLFVDETDSIRRILETFKV